MLIYSSDSLKPTYAKTNHHANHKNRTYSLSRYFTRHFHIIHIYSKYSVLFRNYGSCLKTHRLEYTPCLRMSFCSFLNYVLVDGKFYSLFSMLFGIGCVIQYNNLTSHNKAFAPFFRKRMFWLLIFGLIHLVLFWAR